MQKIGHDFGMRFYDLPPLQSDFKDLFGDLAHVFPPQITPGRLPFRARMDHTTASGLQWRDPTRRGPEARRIFTCVDP